MAITLRPLLPLEKGVERYLVNKIRRLWPGSKCIKTNMRNWPDRLIFLPGQVTAFVETKRPSNKNGARKVQEAILQDLRDLGYIAVVANTKEQVNVLIEILQEETNELG